MTVDLQSVSNILDDVRQATLQRLAPLSEPQLDWSPPQHNGAAEWSLGEVFMHIALDEIYLRELIARPLIEGVQPPEEVRFLPPAPPAGYSKEVILFWFERARLETDRLLNNWPAYADLELKHTGGLQSMNGLEWLAGYASHEAFHHSQIDQLVDSLPPSQAELD